MKEGILALKVDLSLNPEWMILKLKYTMEWYNTSWRRDKKERLLLAYNSGWNQSHYIGVAIKHDGGNSYININKVKYIYIYNIFSLRGIFN